MSEITVESLKKELGSFELSLAIVETHYKETVEEMRLAKREGNRGLYLACLARIMRLSDGVSALTRGITNCEKRLKRKQRNERIGSFFKKLVSA